MHPRRDAAVFAASVIALSLLLSFFARNFRGNYLLVIAITSVILSARGVPWGRKAVFGAVALGGFAAFEVAFDALGLTARLADVGVEAAASALGLLYAVFVLAYPVAVLVLFVGRDPSILWTQAAHSSRNPEKAKGTGR